MKINKLFFGLLGMATLAMTACSSDDDDFSLATVTGQQVYFSNEFGETFEIDPDANVTNMPIYRIETSGSYTANLKVTKPDNSLFTIPTSVTFEDGQAVANLPISYDKSKIVRGDYEDITIEIADSTVTTPFGISAIAVKVGATAWTEWQKWNDNGTATYTYVNFWSGDDPDVTFLYRQNTANPNQYQFKIGDENVGVMYGIELLLDYDKSTGIVSAASQFSGYTHSTYGAVNVTDSYNYWVNIRGKGEDQISGYGIFDEENGYIYIPLCYYVTAGMFGDDYEIITINGYDRKDLSAEAVYSGKFIDAKDNYFVLTDVTLGEDVSKAYVALVYGALTEDILKQIVSGSYENMQEITESGRVSFAANDLEDGDYTIVVVPFLEKEAQPAVTSTFKYETGDKETWNVVGSGVYTYTVGDYSQSQGGGIYEGSLESVLYQSSKDQTRYKIAPWAGEASNGLIFTLNADGTIVVDVVDTGDAYDEYGEIYATDLVTAQIADIPSTYNPETGVFSFNLAWQVEAGSLAFTMDTFTLTAAQARAITTLNKGAKLVEGKSLLKQKTPKRHLTLK